jgi:hypothetical protein
MKQEFIAKKKGPIIRVILKVVAFIGMLIYLIWRLQQENWSKVADLHALAIWMIFIAFFMMFLNQWIEFRKWYVLAAQLVSNRNTIWKSYFGGIASGFVTPNGWGNFIGRMVFFKKKDRLYIILASILTNASQVMPTVIFGAIAAILSDRVPLLVRYLSVVVAIVLPSIYFFNDRILPKRKVRQRSLRHLQLVQSRVGNFKLKLFLWSVLRYLVFSVQYVLLIMAFGYTDFWYILHSVWLIYLLTSFVPSLWSGKILIRETAAIYVFAGSGLEIPDIVLASLLIWFINIVIPALVSSFVWLPVSIKKSHVVS